MRVGYIREIDLGLNPHLTEKFKYIEANATRRIGVRKDTLKCKLFYGTLDYEDVKHTTDEMKKNPELIIIREPFLVDDELKEKVVKWVKWANSVDEKEYNPFA